MTRDEALALHTELEELLAMGPGGISDHLRNRLKRIRFAFGMAAEADSYLRQKVDTACRDLEIWLSPRKWQQWDSDPERFRVIVSNAVYSAHWQSTRSFLRSQGKGKHHDRRELRPQEHRSGQNITGEETGMTPSEQPMAPSESALTAAYDWALAHGCVVCCQTAEELVGVATVWSPHPADRIRAIIERVAAAFPGRRLARSAPST